MLAAAEDAVPTFKQHWVNLLSTCPHVKELNSHCVCVGGRGEDVVVLHTTLNTYPATTMC